MRHPRTLALVLVPLLALAPAPARAGDEPRLADAVRAEKFPDGKRKAVLALAAKRGDAARKELLALAHDEDSWTRDAGVHGLVLLGDRAADEAALDALERTHSLASQIVEAIAARRSFSIDLVAERYKKTEGFRVRPALVEIAGALRTDDAAKFLRDLVNAPAEGRDEECRLAAWRRSRRGSRMACVRSRSSSSRATRSSDPRPSRP